MFCNRGAIMKSIYFLRAGKDGPVKIGITSGNYHARIGALQVGCPWQIVPLGSLPGTSHHEQWLHRRFASIRMAGEWFQPSPELLSAICEILAPGYSWPTSFTVEPIPVASAQTLINRIDLFLSITDMSAAEFGRGAVKDPNFISDLRAGRSPSLRLLDRVETFMRAKTEGVAA